MKPLSRILSIAAICALALAGVAANPAVMASGTPPPLQLDFTTVASGLTEPLLVANAGDGSNRLFIVQQTGQILILKNGSLNSTPFLDVSGLSDFTDADSEQGLLGLAFDPNYATNGYFYITYTTNTGGIPCPYVPTNGQTCNYTTTLARYQVSSNPDVADPTTATVLLSAPKVYTNHNGGMVAFGPDGYLYMSVGDGGSGGDPDGNSQSLDTLSGKLLRLDVDGTPDTGKNYAVPHSNPFYGSTDANVQQEIWAYGLRNPWRFSFDRTTGDLYIGDVGQDRQEEIDFQAAGSAGGQNYGWHILEGILCYNPSSGCKAPSHYVAPIAVYNHGTNDSIGCAVMGGYVYRGSLSVVMRGYYLYGDLCSGKVFGLIKSGSTWRSSLLASTGYNITSFGQDEQGELYLTDYAGGQVVQISHHITNVTTALASLGGQDGFIAESAVGSGLGGAVNSTAAQFALGDSAANRQYRAVLSFNTAALPDDAVITAATLDIRLASQTKVSPFSALGNLDVDMAVPNFGASAALEAGDFQAAPTQALLTTFNPVPSAGWYSADIPSGDLGAISLTGTTQFRLEFSTASNVDGVANYALFNSGNARRYRPVLVIQYHIP